MDSANQKLHGVQEKLHQSWDDWVKSQPDAKVEEQTAPKTEVGNGTTLKPIGVKTVLFNLVATEHFNE